jgi:hypothetical protein
MAWRTYSAFVGPRHLLHVYTSICLQSRLAIVLPVVLKIVLNPKNTAIVDFPNRRPDFENPSRVHRNSGGDAFQDQAVGTMAGDTCHWPNLV